jgi:hypothetical protein
MEGGATCAAAVATWALVRIRGDVLSGVAASCSHTGCHFLRHSHLVALVGLLIGALLLLDTLRIGVCVSMERVILLLSSVWGVGMLVGVCTLGTCCMLGVAGGVAVSSKQPGCVCVWACVVSMIR